MSNTAKESKEDQIIAEQREIAQPITDTINRNGETSVQNFTEILNTANLVTTAVKEVTTGSIAKAPEKPTLPILEIKRKILDTIKNNIVTIITAETGAGKSTQVPQFLLDDGYQVIVTQPRRLAAKSLAQRVAYERGEKLGGDVGFHTAEERVASPNTKLLFCTDGLQLVKELTGQGVKGRKMALVLDEVHEWNLNIETLIAWVKKQVKQGVDIKIVLMSATLNSNELAKYFDNDGQNAPVIEVEGKLFTIKESQINPDSMTSTIIDLAGQKRNVLVFQPGKKEIEKTIEQLKGKVDAEILPLHGDLDPSEQQKVFKHYSKPKIIVSTNVAQTSITIDDIDAVVDTGVERRIETISGVESLLLKDISQADCKQRRGRAGRTKEGIYVLCSNSNLSSRDEFSIPEILRLRLDQMVLRLSANGLDATNLEFFHQPDKAKIIEAKNTLIALGAMTKDGQITKIGRDIAKLPIAVNTGRMVLEAIKHKCVDEVITIAACLEVGGINDKSNNWRSLTQENTSDLLAQLDLFNKASKMDKNQLAENGIHMKAFFRAKEIRKHLFKAIVSSVLKNQIQSTNKSREAILKSITAGMVDHLYQRQGGEYYYGKEQDSRLLGKESVIGRSDWIVGIPKNISFTDRRGRPGTLSILTMCSAVKIEWLLEMAPHLISKENGKFFWNRVSQEVSFYEYISFNKTKVAENLKEAEISNESLEVFIENLYENNVGSAISNELAEYYRDLRNKLESLYLRSNGATKRILKEDILNLFRNILGQYQITSLKKFEEVMQDKVDIEELKLKIEDYISQEEIETIEKENPLRANIKGQEFDISYSFRNSYDISKGTFAYINIKLEEVVELEEQDIGAVFADDRILYFKIIDNYSFNSIYTLQSIKDSFRNHKISYAWDNFIYGEGKDKVIQLNENNKFPELPEKRIFEEYTQSIAYPGFYEYYGNYFIKWFKTEEEAEQSSKKSFNHRDQLLLSDIKYQIKELFKDIFTTKKKIRSEDENFQLLSIELNKAEQEFDSYYDSLERMKLLIENLKLIKVNFEKHYEKDLEIQQKIEGELDLQPSGEQEYTQKLPDYYGVTNDGSISGGIFADKLKEALGLKKLNEKKPKTKAAPIQNHHQNKNYSNISPTSELQIKEEEISFRKLEEMSEEETYREYEANEEEIKKIITENPNIESISDEVGRKQSRLDEIEKELKILIDIRDQTQNSNKKEKAIENLSQLRNEKNELRDQLVEFKKEENRLSEKIIRLKNLKERQSEIEKKL